MGDKILEVNGHSFYGMTHAEAVTIMRNAWNLIMYLESPTNSENTPGWRGGMFVMLNYCDCKQSEGTF